MNVFRKSIISYSFAVFIAFFFANQMFDLIEDKEYNENKKKASFPIIDINKLDGFPSNYESYIADNFSLRGFFLDYMGKINIDIWNKSPKPDNVIVGNENWLFNVKKELDLYSGKSNLSSSQLEDILQEFRFRKNVLEDMGIKMYFVIHPTKYALYSEYLPSYLLNNNGYNVTSQIVEYFNNNSDIEVLCSKDFIESYKNEQDLFFKSDNHWNYYGSYYAAKGLLNEILSEDKIQISNIKDLCHDTVKNWRGNLANMTGIASRFEEPKIILSDCNINLAKRCDRYKHESFKGYPYGDEFQESYWTSNDSLPSVVVIRDSFGLTLVPFMKNSFNYSTFVFDAWRYDLNLAIIEKEKPDIVIFMMLESLIPDFVMSLKDKRN